MDQADLEKLWAITIPTAPLDSSEPGRTYKPPLDSAGTLFVPPPTDSDSGGPLVGSAPPPGGVSAHVSLLRSGATPEELARSAGYELREVIGQGGMGVVYRARQASLQRDVAIKTVKERGKGEPKFVSEARATGQLDHPNIVPVYDLGATSDGETILAMKLVEGGSWKELLHPKTPEAEARAARYELEDHLEVLLQVSNAVGFAHSRHLVHCDLKPENVMLGDFGEVLVMDWGLAVDVSEEPAPDSTLVHKSAIKAPCGTPAYMPPELAAGEGAKISPRTDVYLLGAILVELLTGSPPHNATKLPAVIYQAFLSHPPALPGVPDELRAIAHRALARAPEDRYPDVAEFRDAVRGFLKHRESLVISDAARARLDRARAAATTDAAYQDYSAAIAGYEHALVLWDANPGAQEGIGAARRAFAETALAHEDLRLAEAQVAQLPAAPETQALAGRIQAARAERARAARQALALRVGLAAALFVLVIGLAVGFVLVRGARDEAVRNAELAEASAAEARAESQRAETERARAADAQHLAEQELAGALVAQGTMLMTRERYVRARETFQRAEALSARTGLPLLPAQVGRWEAERYAPGPLMRFPAPSPVTATAADDATVWVGCADGQLLSFDLLRGTELGRQTLPGGAIRALAARGRTLLAASADGSLRSFVGGELHAEVLDAHPGGVLQLETYEITRGEHREQAISSGADGLLRVWSLPGLEPLFQLEHPGGPAPDVCADWGAGFTGSQDGSLHWWAFWRGANHWSYTPEVTGLRAIDAVACAEWQPPDLRLVPVPQLVSATAGLLTLWEFHSDKNAWRPGPQLAAHRANVEDLRFTHDGAHFVSLSADGELRVWTHEGEPVRFLDGAGRGPMTLTPRGFFLVTRDPSEREPAALIWDLGLAHEEPSGARISAGAQTLSVAPPTEDPDAPPPPPVSAVALDPAGAWVAGGTEAGSVHLFDADSGRELETLRGHAGAILGMRFLAPDASGSPRLRTCGADGALREWRLLDSQGLPVASWRSELAEISAVAWTADGALVGGAGGELVLLRDRGGSEVERSALPGLAARVGAVAVTPELFVAGSAAGELRGLGPDGAARFAFAHPRGVSALALEDDGASLLVGDETGGIVRYALPSGERLGSLEAHSATIRALSFLGSDGAISVGEDGRACLWSLVTQRETYLSPPGGPLADIALSLDPLRVASASREGVLLWDKHLDPVSDPAVLAPVARGLRFLRRGSLRAGIDLLEEARRAGEQVPLLPLVRAYWSLGYPLGALRLFEEQPPGPDDHEAQILLHAVTRDARSGSLLGYSGGRTRTLTPLDERRLLSAGELGEYRVWDLPSGSRREAWGVREARRNLTSVAVSPDRQHVVGLDAWDQVRVWTAERELAAQFESKGASRVYAARWGILTAEPRALRGYDYAGHLQGERDLGLAEGETLEAFSYLPEADLLACVERASSEVRVYRGADGALLHRFMLPEDKAPDGLRFLQGGAALFAYRRGAELVVDLEGQVLQELPAGPDALYSCAVDPEGERIGSVDRAGHVRVWDVAARREVLSADVQEFPMVSGFNGDGSVYVVGSIRGVLLAFAVPAE
ncbi:MAG: serine/threonine-protein kinase [Planctomycetota bacterium]